MIRIKLTGAQVGMTVLLTSALTLITVMFSVAEVIWLRPYPFARASEVHLVGRETSGPIPVSDQLPRLVANELLKSELGRGIVGFELDAGEVLVGEVRIPVGAIRLTPNAVDVLGLRLHSGGSIPSDRKSAAVSEWFWEDYLKRDPSVLGSTIRFAGNDLSVVAVLANDSPLPLMPKRPALYLFENQRAPAAVGVDPVRALIRLPRGLLESEIVQRLEQQLQGLKPDLASTQLVLLDLPGLTQAIAPGLPLTLWLIGILTCMALSSCCYLAMGRAVKLSSEWTIRSALGATTARIVSTQLGEVASVGFCSIGCAAALSWIIVLLASSDLESALALPRPPVISASALAIAGGIGVLCTIVLAILWGRLVGMHMAGGNKVGAGGVRKDHTRRILIATQLILAGTLIGVATSSVGMLVRVLNVDTGMDLDGVIHSSLSFSSTGEPADAEQARVVWSQLNRELAALPGVDAVALADLPPFLASPSMEAVTIPGREEAVKVSIRRVTSGYFDVLGVDLKRGRFWAASDESTAPAVAVVNERAARLLLDGEAAIGRAITLSGLSLTIVGIAGDSREGGVQKDPIPTIYVPHSDANYRRYTAARAILVRAKGGAEGLVLQALEGALSAYRSRGRVTRSMALENRLPASVRAPALYVWMTGALSWMAVIIAGLGTFSAVAQAAATRRHEVAVRTVLGATRLLIVWQFLKELILTIVIGAATGGLLGYTFGKAFGESVFGSSELSGLVFGAGLTLLCVITVIAVVLPGLRATQGTPRELLSVHQRHEH